MGPSGFPTGTVSSGRDDHSAAVPSRDAGSGPGGDPQARIAELERENEALREAVARQRRENERIVERYERLLDDCDGEREGPALKEGSSERGVSGDTDGVVGRVVGLVTNRT
ncbi:hypothetical protein [Haloplanus sp.]|uniref:hypothetical protein n=1 Tax=Haloplanus sp. TaxID=1961696 RepID=UPI00262F6A52|nr:hypothetical protein [Haloplanus sp.]